MNSRDRIVFFDLETGGLDPLRHPIIQAAMIADALADVRATVEVARLLSQRFGLGWEAAHA